jgi:ribose-phosphate pyrophosphokinase
VERADPPLEIVIGSGSDALGREIANRCPDGELDVAIEPAIVDSEIYVVQSLSPPVNDRLVELLLLLDACRREGAGRITVVIPYLGYARADRRTEPGQAVALGVLADLLGPPRVDRLMVMDPHVPQVESIFRVPVVVLSAVPTLASQIRVENDVSLVAPDAGAIEIAERYSDELGTTRVSVVLKERLSGREVETRIVASDGRGDSMVIVDDMITTGGTIVAAVESLRAASVAWDSLQIVATHGVLVEDAVDVLSDMGAERVVVSDTVYHESLPAPFRTVSVAGVFARMIRDLGRGWAGRG